MIFVYHADEDDPMLLGFKRHGFANQSSSLKRKYQRCMGTSLW
jgi:hypothetical protein